jgi:hypothetical protein
MHAVQGHPVVQIKQRSKRRFGADPFLPTNSASILTLYTLRKCSRHSEWFSSA